VTDEKKRRKEAAEFLDNLSSFLMDDGRSVDQIKEDLHAQGVDSEGSLTAFRRILSEHAPTWQERAKRARTRAEQIVKEHVHESRETREGIKQRIKDLIDSMKGEGAPITAGAFFMKFQEAKDEDLQSLLEDLEIQRDLMKRKE